MTSIMIIDNDDLLVRAMEIVLEKKGFEAISALGGEEALKILETARPDLILLDIMMPGMDGWETLQRIKGDEALAPIPVIMLTVMDPTGDILAKKDELGFRDYVIKPFDMDYFFSQITKVLQS